MGNNHDITAVEHDEQIASFYKKYFPNDNLIVSDAHQYLLDNFQKYDFIWASPPCPTHSCARAAIVIGGGKRKGEDIFKAKYPDMKLYQEIILLQNFYKGQFCVENVIPYYKPLIPGQQRERHIFWSNFYIPEFNKNICKHDMKIKDTQRLLGYELTGYKGDKRKILRNCVIPELGKFILDSAINQQQTELFT